MFYALDPLPKIFSTACGFLCVLQYLSFVCSYFGSLEHFDRVQHGFFFKSFLVSLPSYVIRLGFLGFVFHIWIILFFRFGRHYRLSYYLRLQWMRRLLCALRRQWVFFSNFDLTSGGFLALFSHFVVCLPSRGTIYVTARFWFVK